MPNVTIKANNVVPHRRETVYMGKPHSEAPDQRRMRFKFWYDTIIDWMLVNPDKSLKDCAKALGRNVDTIYSITHSDIFKARLAQRRMDFNNRLAAGLSDATSAVALAAMKEIATRINTNAAAIPTVVLNDVAHKALSSLGYGVAPVAPQVVVNNTDNRTISVSADVLREAKASMRQVHEANSQIIEVEPAKLSRKEERDLESLI